MRAACSAGTVPPMPPTKPKGTGPIAALRRGADSTLERVATALPRRGLVERFLLRRWWNMARADMLDSYLVSGYQNPRINIQSILLRHFLVRRLFGPDEFTSLMADELRFAVELNEIIRTRAIELDVKVGAYLNPRKQAEVRRVEEAIRDRETEYAVLWQAALAGREATRLRVIELACGSANDYRAFVEYGLAEHLDYVGVDLTAKNIANARRRFPGVDFRVSDIRDVDEPDGAFDYVIASDIYEHLALDSMEEALDESMRLARRGLALTFFNMADIDEHEVRPQRMYHWNRLSRPLIEERIRPRFGSIEVIGVHDWLKAEHDYAHTYNRRAVTIFAERVDSDGGLGVDRSSNSDQTRG